ncbi:MAG TPA: hypothetical protein VFC18_13360 [Burkholderiales bacterium]|nr:hypothetical protein [Burkholderiales bacterium]
MTKVRYPTPAELYAVEQEARRARAQAIAEALHAAAASAKAFFTRAATPKGVRHA